MRRPYEQLGPDTTSGEITGDDTPSANRMDGGRSGSAFLTRPPALSLPKGGGAIRGIGEKFTANPVTGTGTVSVPIAVSPGRNGFGPQLSLSYDSGAGNGPFGLGWNLNLPSITRKTDKGLPRYLDHEEPDVFILAGAEDLVPVLGSTGQREADHRVTVYGSPYHVRCYRPRIEGLFALIERWTADKDPDNTFWRTISRDNVTTWFGRTANSRIYDPDDASRVFQWLICESYDDKGNVAVYHYVAEDGRGVDQSALAEVNRPDHHRTANRYLKRVRYGNVKPFLPTLSQAGTEWHEPSRDPDNWMFEVVLDYGDHADPNLRRDPNAAWPARKDAFSTHRAGFEMRTYRLCRRVLMFHHFPDQEEVGRDCLVRSTDFEYAEPANLADATRAGYTILQSVSHRSYQRRRNTDTTYEQRQLAPVSFAYSQPVVDQTVRSVDPGQLANLPVGTQGSGYQWIDLDGEGLSGVLTEQAGAWYYKPNLGEGQFGPIRQVAPLPAMAVASGSRHQFMDLAGDGEIDVVDFSGPTPGFHERDRDEGWKRHVPFASLPNIDWNDPNLRFVDLTGDGHADALLTEQDVFTWYPSLDERGFAASERTHQATDENEGPRLVFADGTQTVYLADMCGDGLTDLVRIRNGEVCYWPNLGYGRFGRKVTLGNSPRFDHSDLFDPRRIRLADIDGSGPIDIIYLGRQGARLYFNRSGNSLSDALPVALPLATENLAAVQVADLLGNGTACLVWNSHLPADARNPVRYIDLMSGIKPHLLIESRNNLGGSTEIEYTPSTRFYLQDQQAGTPWITRLPFPVHCVSKVTVRDKWRGTAFSSTYSYHHGYFDGIEREFRGFGRVEQVDVEDYGLFAGYDLRLMAVDSIDGLPSEGRKLVIVALIDTDLHIRVFDINGERSVDKAENELVSGETLTALKQQLNPIPDESDLSPEQRQKLIQDATSIAGHTLFAQGNVESPWITSDQTLYQPPVKTITWYHTGAAIDRQRILGAYEHEYFPQRFADRLPQDPKDPNGFRERPLPEPELPAPLSVDEWREALRACKGMVLRQEVYELDVNDLTGTSPKHTPVRLFSAATHNCRIQRLQPRGRNRHAVFLVTESEALSYHYELTINKDNTSPLKPDPRIAHTFNLRHDDYGNLQQAVTIGYGRWRAGDFSGLPQPDLIAAVQAEEHIAYTEIRYTADVELPTRTQPPTQPGPATRHRRLRLPCETLTYELSGITKADPRYYAPADFARLILSEVYGSLPDAPAAPQNVPRKEYHEHPDQAALGMRIVEHTRTLFFNDARDDAPPDNDRPLPFGKHGPRGLKYEDYKLALTDGMLTAVFGTASASDPLADKLAWEAVPASNDTDTKTCRALLQDPSISGYSPGTQIGLSADQYWMRSGTAGFTDGAHQHFFLPESFKDPFGNEMKLEYDLLDLFVRRTEDAKGNVAAIADDATGKPRFDYRALAPIEMVDANGNHSEAVFDIRGLVVAVAVKGKKVNGPWEGDHLDGWTFDQINPPEAAIAEFCLKRNIDANQERQARTWLGTATTRFVYHFGESRNAADHATWLQRMAGACGIAREIHANQPGGATSPLQVSLECSDGSGNVLMKKVQAEPETPDGPLRWIINGLTVLNNKGKPVKQYEPSFSEQGFGCEMPPAAGVTVVIYYDAAGRTVRTEMPDGTFNRVEFSPWHVKSFDANDTVKDSRWYAERLTATERGVPLHGPNDTQQLKAEAAAAEALAQNASVQDKRAAGLAAQHADTPVLTILDSLGRDVISIAHNRTPDDNRQWHDEFYSTYTKLDAEGKPLWIRDTRGNLVMQYISPPKPTSWADESNENIPSRIDPSTGNKVYSAPCYDIAANLLFQHSMDAGDRWMLMDAAGKPMLAWDFNDFQNNAGTTSQTRLFLTDYDELHRPTAQWLKINNKVPALIEAFEYCDTSHPNGAVDLDDAKLHNLIGQAVKHWDPSGLATVKRIDLSGQPAHVTRTLIKATVDGNLDGVLDWNLTNRQNLLENETFIQLTEFDALGRMTKLYNWHRDITFNANGTKRNTPGSTNRVAVYVPEYNERGALTGEVLHVRAMKRTVNGQVAFTKSATTNHNTQAIKDITYNAKGQKLTLELGNGTTTTYSYDDQTFRLMELRTVRATSPRGIQNLSYTYDPVGNITHINDAAQETVFSNNSIIRPEHHYVYDALYRLIEATGRENPNAHAPPENKEGTWPQGLFPSGDQPRNYTQRYTYDEVGNFVAMQHLPSNGNGWTRHYTIHPDSNRLHQTWYGSNTANAVTYRHDPHGNMLNLNRTPEDWGLDIRWDWRDMIRGFDCIGGGLARYHYGIDKQRTRKHITRNTSAGGTITEDRIYLGGYELYRRRNPKNQVVEEIESLHLFEGEQRVLLVDDVITAKSSAQPGPNGLRIKEQTLFRYQYSNHMGSACLELDDSTEIISYEEYHPYGTSAYRAMKRGIEAPPKRYRYTGMERDEESGFEYRTGRYSLASLGRWLSCDPLALSDGVNVYSYVHDSPINFVDHTGTQSEPWWRFTEAGAQYPTGKHDLLTPDRGYDIGLAPANFVVNLFVTAINLLTIPVNALTEVAAIPEEAARAAGVSETNIASLNFALLMIGVGEVAALPKIGSVVTEVKAALTSATEVKNVVNANIAMKVLTTSEEVVNVATEAKQVVASTTEAKQVVAAATETKQAVDVATETEQVAVAAPFAEAKKVTPSMRPTLKPGSYRQEGLTWPEAARNDPGYRIQSVQVNVDDTLEKFIRLVSPEGGEAAVLTEWTHKPRGLLIIDISTNPPLIVPSKASPICNKTQSVISDLISESIPALPDWVGWPEGSGATKK